MNKICILAAALATAAAAQAQTVTLDLTQSTTPLTFNATNGMWNGTFDDDETAIESQCFNFVHSSMGAYQTWWGFTASNHADNSRRDDILTYQYSNMAKGGIVLNEDGTVKKNSFGAPVTSAAVPYMVAYYSPYMGRKPLVMTFTNGDAYLAQSVYLNLNTYAYYPMEFGALPARAFTEGDNFKVQIIGVAPDKTEKTVEVTLGSYTNGDLTLNRGWRYVDLSELGLVNEIYFKVTGTDTGAYGLNTPSYFCLDKLTVTRPEQASATDAELAQARLTYNRTSATLSVEGSDFVAVYDAAAQLVASGNGSSLDLSSLPAGLYVARAADSTLKFVR